MIENLLPYSKLGTRGNLFESTDCEPAFQDAVSILQVAADDSSGQITHYAPLPAVLVDAGQLLQRFEFSSGNAVKSHTDSPPRIRRHGSKSEASR
jgi:light-regulated signal transduction histidine kinase (bacteriophytochrome)